MATQNSQGQRINATMCLKYKVHLKHDIAWLKSYLELFAKPYLQLIGHVYIPIPIVKENIAVFVFLENRRFYINAKILNMPSNKASPSVMKMKWDTRVAW